MCLGSRKTRKEITYPRAQELIKKRRSIGNRRETTTEELHDLNKRIKKALREDNEKHILETVKEELDVRERWARIRELKREYNPTPYNRKDKDGNIVQQNGRADTTATYLATQQWGHKTGSPKAEEISDTPIIPHTHGAWDRYNPGPITMKELIAVINK